MTPTIPCEGRCGVDLAHDDDRLLEIAADTSYAAVHTPTRCRIIRTLRERVAAHLDLAVGDYDVVSIAAETLDGIVPVLVVRAERGDRWAEVSWGVDDLVASASLDWACVLTAGHLIRILRGGGADRVDPVGVVIAEQHRTVTP